MYRTARPQCTWCIKLEAVGKEMNWKWKSFEVFLENNEHCMLLLYGYSLPVSLLIVWYVAVECWRRTSWHLLSRLYALWWMLPMIKSSVARRFAAWPYSRCRNTSSLLRCVEWLWVCSGELTCNVLLTFVLYTLHSSIRLIAECRQPTRVSWYWLLGTMVVHSLWNSEPSNRIWFVARMSWAAEFRFFHGNCPIPQNSLQNRCVYLAV